MKNLFLFSFAFCALLLANDPFKLIRADELDKLLHGKTKTVAVFDANNEKTRKAEGIIPGAKLLSSYNEFDVAKEMPADKSTTLVFYCANTQCMASHAAAKRASENGYTNVNVMSDGIQGWKKAGKPSSKI